MEKKSEVKNVSSPCVNNNKLIYRTLFFSVKYTFQTRFLFKPKQPLPLKRSEQGTRMKTRIILILWRGIVTIILRMSPFVGRTHKLLKN